MREKKGRTSAKNLEKTGRPTVKLPGNSGLLRARVGVGAAGIALYLGKVNKDQRGGGTEVILR